MQGDTAPTLAPQTPVSLVQDRPGFSSGYGISPEPDGMLDWHDVTVRLEASRNYWIGTTGPDGRPHAAPVWGVWIEDTLYSSTDPASRKGRNLTSNPATAVHLESGDDAVLMEGHTDSVTDPAFVERVSAVYAKKYGLGLTGEGAPPGVVLAFRPHLIMAWREQDFPKSATRWRLGARSI